MTDDMGDIEAWLRKDYLEGLTTRELLVELVRAQDAVEAASFHEAQIIAAIGTHFREGPLA